VVAGQRVGIVSEAMGGLRNRQIDRSNVFEFATDNVASRWDGISMSVADRMEQSCPMCGAYTLWQCKCIEDGVKLINPEALRCKTDRSMAELNTAMKSMAMETPTQPPQQSGFRTPVSIAKPFKTAKAPKGRVLDLTTPVKPQ
jgi:hypothetical protein